MQVAPSGCKWCHVVAKFNPSHGVNFWVRCASGNVFMNNFIFLVGTTNGGSNTLMRWRGRALTNWFLSSSPSPLLFIAPHQPTSIVSSFIHHLYKDTNTLLFFVAHYHPSLPHLLELLFDFLLSAPLFDWILVDDNILTAPTFTSAANSWTSIELVKAKTEHAQRNIWMAGRIFVEGRKGFKISTFKIPKNQNTHSREHLDGQMYICRGMKAIHI